MTPVLSALKRGHQDELLFAMTYPQYVKKFRRAVSALGAPSDKVLPYCSRHSGASIDRARKTRTQEEVARRGRWSNLKSTQRYEKAASLGCKLVAVDARPSDLVRGLQESSRGYYRPWERHGCSPCALNRRWYLDCSCGSGKVGNELVRQKQLVYFLDRVLGPRGDLCSRKNLSGIARDAGNDKILGSMLARPCSSHSRIQ